MVRTQIQLTEEQASQIMRIAAERQISRAEVIRESIDRSLSSHDCALPQEERVRRAIAAAGRFRSGGTDGSAQHDRHLSDAYSA